MQTDLQEICNGGEAEIRSHVLHMRWMDNAVHHKEWEQSRCHRKRQYGMDETKEGAMNRHIEFLRGESSAGGSNWNSEMQAAADEIKRLEMLVRECHAALRDLLDKRPMQGAMLCGSTTLGNLFVDLNGAVNTMADSRRVKPCPDHHISALNSIIAWTEGDITGTPEMRLEAYARRELLIRNAARAAINKAEACDDAVEGAAPDLLAALQWVIDYAPTGADEARCRAAIAKATRSKS